MNVQNITVMASQLKAIGFDNMGYPLLKRICFAPANFIITEKLSKVPENISFNFYFEKAGSSETYNLIYYDAILQKENSFTDTNIEGINIRQTDECMMQVDWKTAFDFSKQKPFNSEDKSSYENEVKISKIIGDLKKIEANDEGKAISIALKQKYWSDIPYTDIMGPIYNGRSKSEISQRFYFSEGQPVISADEAYRFLLNRWLEKQMQSRKKQLDNGSETDSEDNAASSGSGLLRKRRIGSNKINKRYKSSQD